MSAYWDGDIPWVGIRDATDNHGLVLRDTAQHVSAAGIANSSARVLPAGTVCLSRTASVGFVVMMGRPMATSQDFVNWVCGPELEPHYLKYILLAEQDSIRRFAHGTTHQTMYYPEAKALHVCIPDAPQQRRALAVLKGLDDLIDNNRAQRTRIDQLGEASVRRVASSGLALLSGGSSEWRLGRIGDLCPVVETGRRPKGGVRGITRGTPSIGAESIDGLAAFDFSKTKYVPTPFAEAMRSGVLESRDVLVYKDGGKPGGFRPHVGMFGDGFPFLRAVINEHVFRIRSGAELTNPYLYWWLRQPELMEAMKRAGTGAAIPGINSTAFKSLPVAVPPPPVRAMLYPVLDALVGEALAIATEERRLQQARDELLPLLLSGRIRPGEVAS